MACFAVPMVEAVISTAVTKVVEKREDKILDSLECNASEKEIFNKERFSLKLKNLNYMLWGGSGLLAFEHLWHGEIQQMLTGTGSTVEILREMSTTGVAMAIAITSIWGVVTYIQAKLEKRNIAGATVED